MGNEKRTTFASIDDYIANFPDAIGTLLEQVRATIRQAAPDARETISYGMPAFEQQGIVVYFAAFEHHIGFYPTPSGISAFGKELAGFRHSKGAVQFPLDRPLPLSLIARIVEYRVNENLTRREK